MSGKGPRLLAIDIETAPNLVDVWGLWNQNVGINQINRAGYTLSFAAKFLGDKGKPKFFGLNTLDPEELAVEAWELFDEADAVVTWNGRKFDEPWLRYEFLIHGLNPPSPWRSLDLLQVVRKNFKFPSYKLQYVSTALGFEGKVSHSGHDLWTRVIRGDEKAWKEFEKYNVQDVVLLERLYERLLPWIDNHPNTNLWNLGHQGCPNCSSTDVQKRGLTYLRTGAYQRYVCNQCGRWYRDNKREFGVNAQ